MSDSVLARAVKKILLNVGLFSRIVVRVPLRPYQEEPARAIVDSVLNKKGLTFLVVMSRQAGKNELSAQLEAYLLNIFQKIGGFIVKAQPTFKPQAINSLMRLKDRLDNQWNKGKWRSRSGYMVSLGKATAIFFSAEKGAKVVGATASMLLECDEAQDVDPRKWAKDFIPMGASTNVTTAFYGTVWTSRTLLGQTLRYLKALEQKDGIKRVFMYDADHVRQYVPAYGEYVDKEVARLGRDHPLIKTQYFLEEIDAEGKALSEEQRAQLRGDHARYHRRLPGKIYVAGLDMAGEAEEEMGLEDMDVHGKRDSTTLTIGEAELMDLVGLEMARVQVVERYQWVGIKHTDLYARLVDLLRNTWGVRKVVVDASGVGHGVASFLEKSLGSHVVTGVLFDGAWSLHSELAFNFLAAINAGRFKEYEHDNEEITTEAWSQYESAILETRPNKRVKMHVPEEEGHDDLLVSALLLLKAADEAAPYLRGYRSMEPGERRDKDLFPKELGG